MAALILFAKLFAAGVLAVIAVMVVFGVLFGIAAAFADPRGEP